MSATELEQRLRDLPRIGTCLKHRGYRQVWRFEWNGKGFYLKFYPRRGSAWKRRVRGNPAEREFNRLMMLQKAGVPSPRAVAHLGGFLLDGHKGDAVILAGIEPSVTLAEHVRKCQMRGEPIDGYRDLSRQVREILARLGHAKLGHGDLHLGNFLLSEGKVYLLDGYAVQTGGLKMRHLQALAHSVRGVATQTDIQRVWDKLGPGGPLPAGNPVSRRQWRKLVERATGDNDYFGRISQGDWRGNFFKWTRYPHRESPVSAQRFSREDWEKAWPELWARVEAGTMQPLKRGASGDVWAGTVALGDKELEVVVKRPFKRYWYRYLNEVGRGSRAWRAWIKSWALIVRGIPTAWPLAVMQRRRLGYIIDAAIVFERLSGPTLSAVDLDAMAPEERETLFRRCGRVLRDIDDRGIGHFDAKASNWIVREDDRLGPHPVLVDVDGIRFQRWRALGLERLLRSMKEHPQYTPGDSLALCRGYAPYSPLEVSQ